MLDCRRLSSALMLLLVLPLLLTACFRDTTEVIEQPVARQMPTATVVLEAEPTAPPPTATQEPTVAVPALDNFALSATALIAQQTQTVPEQGLASAQNTAVPTASPTAIPLPRAAFPPGQDCEHEIRTGDTLFKLSLSYGVTVEEIAQASEVGNPDVLAVGQRVVIPGCGTTGFIPPPTSIPLPTIDPASIPTVSAPAEVEIAAADDTRNALILQAQAALLNNAKIDTLKRIQHPVSRFAQSQPHLHCRAG